MKANTRIIALVAMLLLALAMSPAAASDYTLDIFGNANEDETVNMQDVTYTELIILEYRDETELSDAKYDGKINMQDVTQIELIILGKEKELTLLDAESESVTIEKPVRMVAGNAYTMWGLTDYTWWERYGKDDGFESYKDEPREEYKIDWNKVVGISDPIPYFNLYAGPSAVIDGGCLGLCWSDWYKEFFEDLPCCCSTEGEIDEKEVIEINANLFLTSSDVNMYCCEDELRESLEDMGVTFLKLDFGSKDNAPNRSEETAEKEWETEWLIRRYIVN